MPLSRRTVLALSSSLIGLAGCLDDGAGTSSPTASSETGTTSSTPTTSPTATETPLPPLVYPFYVVNRGEAERCVRVSVRAADSPPVVSGTYRVDAGGVLKFTDATTVGTTYAVSLSLPDGRSLSKEWTPEKCLDYAGGREASKAGYVSFDGDSLFFAENGCDAVSTFLQQPSRVDPDSDDCLV